MVQKQIMDGIDHQRELLLFTLNISQKRHGYGVQTIYKG
jgi:hypothetical protein